MGINEEIEGMQLIMARMEEIMDQTPNGQLSLQLMEEYSLSSIRLEELKSFKEQSGELSTGDARAVAYILHQAEVQGRPIPTVEEMFEWAEADDPTPPDPRQDVIDRNRLALRRIKRMALEEQDPGQLASLANKYGRCCGRLVDLLKKVEVEGNKLERWLLGILNAAHAKKMEEWGVESRGPWLTHL